MSSESELKELSQPTFWDNRYATSTQINDTENPDAEPTIESFEWFRTFSKIRPFLEKWLPRPNGSELVLHLGCGNSTLTADLHGLGYANQISVDFSQVMDVRDLKLETSSVDVAIDKGTLDAFLHGSLWDPPDDVRENVGKYVDEVARVLKPGGRWLYITYRQPHFMKPLLAREENWELQVGVLEDPDGGGGFEYFGFIMTRSQKIDP